MTKARREANATTVKTVWVFDISLLSSRHDEVSNALEAAFNGKEIEGRKVIYCIFHGSLLE